MQKSKTSLFEIAATAASLTSANLSRSERLQGIKTFRDQVKAYERKFGPVGPVTQMTNPSEDESSHLQATEKDALAPVKTPDGYVPPANPAHEIRAARRRMRLEQ